MSKKKERQAKLFAEFAGSIIKDVFLNDLTIGEIADELKTHPIFAELAMNERRNVNLFFCSQPASRATLSQNVAHPPEYNL